MFMTKLQLAFMLTCLYVTVLTLFPSTFWFMTEVSNFELKLIVVTETLIYSKTAKKWTFLWRIMGLIFVYERIKRVNK